MLTYKKLGSDADKDAVHKATKDLDKGLFPGAFCYIGPDIAGDKNYCYLKHTDGAGSKVNVAYMAEKEGLRGNFWEGIAQDSLVMNVDDMACVGAVEAFQLTNCIDRNPLVISDSSISGIINGYKNFIKKLSKYAKISMCGGETADTGNNVRTLVVNSDVSARMKRSDVIDASRTSAGDLLVGFASYNKNNSGVGSNGFTLLVHALLNSSYKKKYPETFDEKIKENAYCGKFDLKKIGEALLSPTMTYLPLIKEVLKNHRSCVKGIFHCTGGGLTKPIRFGKNVKYVMDNLLDPGKFFRFVYENVNVEPTELYKTFNMGCRLIVSCKKEVAEKLVKIGKQMGIDSKIIGHVEASSKKGFNQVEVKDPIGGKVLKYEK